VSGGLATLLPGPWRASLEAASATPGFHELDRFLETEWRTATVFPTRDRVFAALAATAPGAVRAVIFGQDPYPTAGNANGLAFSVCDGVRVPASLKNLFAGLSLDLGLPTPSTGNLEPWARRGVLLLNTVLTVREGAPNSHRRKGWEPFTRAIISAVDAQPGPVAFFCFGVPARELAKALVDGARHLVIAAPHPSPLNGHDFVRFVEAERPFSRANAVLQAAGRGAIDWSL
jgi:uracil-DNA glycosylase